MKLVAARISARESNRNLSRLFDRLSLRSDAFRRFIALHESGGTINNIHMYIRREEILEKLAEK